MVTNLTRPANRVVAFDNRCGPAWQHTKEGKNAIVWIRLSCIRFRNNEVRLQLHALACNLAAFMRILALPEAVKRWSLTSLRQELVKVGAGIIGQGRYVAFQMAEIAVPRDLFDETLRLMAQFRAPTPTNEGPIHVKQFIRSWRESLRFLEDETAWNGIVVYSEGDSYAPYLRPVIDALADHHDGTVHYLTSDATDRVLLDTPPHVRGFFVGKGSARIHVFNQMRANVLAMTMPDLNTFHIKRSPKVQHYAYVHHSLVSTHMIYRKGAFDHFDSVLCVGPHHTDEIREWEALQGLPAKQLFDHGYAPLDALIEAGCTTSAPPVGDDKSLNILLAPSWGSEGLMETRAKEVVRILLDAGHFVRVRPHPRTRQIAGPVLNDLAAMFADLPGFDMNEDTTKNEALLQSHVMISDWSGVAMEFAFGLGRPVLFVDVPRKVNNPDYSAVTATPLEVSYREEVGAIIAPDRLDELPAALASLLEGAPAVRARITELRERRFFNLGASAKRGAEILAEIATQAGSRT